MRSADVVLRKPRSQKRDLGHPAPGRGAANTYLAQWADEHISVDERARFREMAEGELLNLHEGNFARYRIRPSEFADWQVVWRVRP